jgi:heptosyltransferase-2
VKKILIIKTAATGDVIRTTTLLHCFLNEEVWWITAKMNTEVLPQKLSCLKNIIAIEDINVFDYFEGIIFDLVLSLDDDERSVALIDMIKFKKLIGAYKNTITNKITYTDDSAHWFELSLISKYSKQQADRMKFEGTMSVQQHLFKMIDREFSGEPYLIYENILPSPVSKRIGIEARSGERWPTKRWNGYEQLSQKLSEEGYEIVCFRQRENIRDYMKDISECRFVLCGDTLAMHIALALKIPTLAIFTCTSATEIYAYGIMEKVVSPCLWEAFFKTDYIAKAVEGVTQEMVYSAFKKLEASALLVT